MQFAVRDGKFDVVIAAGPRVEHWPSVGVRTLSLLCAEMGLSVGQLGGEALTVHGIIPLSGTGGLVIAEDIQGRIHRIHARAAIRITPGLSWPDPFPGWRSQALIPLQTAEYLRQKSQILWERLTVILGTGNRALQFGSTLLENGSGQVLCVESYAQWGAKRFSGWEVEKRHFEMLGGKITEATPLEVIPKAPLLWQLRLQDTQGVRVLEIGRIVSAGPFHNSLGVREYPPGSLLFEFDQTASTLMKKGAEGWLLEEERGRWLAGKIVKALKGHLGPKREELDTLFRTAKRKLKRYFRHQEAPFTPSYQGKWIATADLKKIKTFGGVPQKLHFTQPIASIECFEEIPCHLCETTCPTSAIKTGKIPRKTTVLTETQCTGCGLCLAACPSRSISLIQEQKDQSFSKITLAWSGPKPWKIGEFGMLLNRRGETLSSGRIIDILNPSALNLKKKIKNDLQKDEKVQLLKIQIPSHLLWEARAIKRGRPSESFDEAFVASEDPTAVKQKYIKITLNGEKRTVRDRVFISVALFEIGQSRSTDILLCKDGSCGLCDISVDGLKKLACQTKIHNGMNIRFAPPTHFPVQSTLLCPCLRISQQEVINRLKQGKLRSAEAILSVTQVGGGKCHGQLCMDTFKRVLLDQGLDVSQWIDWRFPWRDWVLAHP